MKAKKILALALAAVLLVAVGVGGTLAYLAAVSQSVTNTFETSGVTITLQEHEVDDTGKFTDPRNPVQSNTYKMIPGYTYDKNPWIEVTYDIPVYVFVQYNNSDADGNYVTADFALDNAGSDWQKLEVDTIVGGPVYWTVMDDVSEGFERVELLTGNQITIVDTYVNYNGVTMPQISFGAWAVQAYKNNDTMFTPAEAWEKRTN